MRIKQFRNLIVFPICLLLFNACEELLIYKLRQVLRNDWIYVATLIITFVICFGFIANWLAPHISKAIEHGHKKSKKKAGRTGIIVFFTILSALIFWLYFVVYTKGPQFLLPVQWR